MRNNWTVKQVSRQDFTWDEIYKAYTDHDRSFVETAKALTQLGRGKVSRQLVRYWINSEDFSDVNEEHFEARQLVAKQRAQDTNRHLRREIRELSRAIDTQEEWETAVLQGIEQIVDHAPQVFTPVGKLERDEKATRGLTVEVLVSDVQVGKLTSNYNSDIARNRMRELGESAAEVISQKISAGFHIERILLVFLGDLIESDEKHNDSAVGCDSSTSEQMANFTEWAFHYILKPLAPLTEHLDVVGIAG